MCVHAPAASKNLAIVLPLVPSVFFPVVFIMFYKNV